MATVINNPTNAPAAQAEGPGMGLVLGVILTIVILFLVFRYGPIGRDRTTNVNVPDRVDVNVNQQP